MSLKAALDQAALEAKRKELADAGTPFITTDKFGDIVFEDDSFYTDYTVDGQVFGKDFVFYDPMMSTFNKAVNQVIRYTGGIPSKYRYTFVPQNIIEKGVKTDDKQYYLGNILKGDNLDSLSKNGIFVDLTGVKDFDKEFEKQGISTKGFLIPYAETKQRDLFSNIRDYEIGKASEDNTIKWGEIKGLSKVGDQYVYATDTTPIGGIDQASGYAGVEGLKGNWYKKPSGGGLLGDIGRGIASVPFGAELLGAAALLNPLTAPYAPYIYAGASGLRGGATGQDPLKVGLQTGLTVGIASYLGGAGGEPTGTPGAVGGTPGVSEVFPVAPPQIGVAPLPPQAAGAGLGALANAPGSSMAVQVAPPTPSSTPVPDSVSLKETLGITPKYGEGATLVPGSAAEALALKTGATLAPVAVPGGSAAPIIDKSFPAPDVPEPFTPTPITEIGMEALKQLSPAPLVAGSAVLGALAPPPEEPPGEASRVYEPRGFDVRLSDVAPIDVAGTPIPTVNFSGATPVEAGGLAAPRGVGSLISIPTYAPTLTYAPMTEGQAMESVYLLPPELTSENASVAPVTPMREGGLAALAQDLASKGRGGDTMLAHITPEEAEILKALGGAGTINPETGLPEFLKIGGIDLNPRRGMKFNFGPLGNVRVGRKSSDLLLAAGAGYAGATGFMGLNPATAGMYYGGFRGLASGNLQEGIMAGLSAYGMGEGFQSYGVGTPAAGAPTAPGGVGGVSGGTSVGPEAGAVTSANVPVGAENPLAGIEYMNTPVAGINPLEGSQLVGTIQTPGDITAASQAAEATRAGFPLSEFDQAIQDAVYGPGGPGVPADVAAYGDTPYKSFGQTAAAPTSAQIAAQERVLYNPLSDPEAGGFSDLGAPFEYQAVSPQNAASTAPTGFLARNLPAGAQKYIADPILDASGMTLAAGTVLGSSLLSGQQEKAAFERQQADAERKRREQLGIYEDLAQRTMGGIRMARAGGLMNLAQGGMTYMEAGGTTGPTGIPRDVTGTGDGMSDSVPATIEGVQEARLADGEFVIPADVVADIGNGSSNAGSKKLYDMMDRIRKARHGTTKQPPEINAERLMPV
jgi:hypothetical protein